MITRQISTNNQSVWHVNNRSATLKSVSKPFFHGIGLLTIAMNTVFTKTPPLLYWAIDLGQLVPDWAA